MVFQNNSLKIILLKRHSWSPKSLEAHQNVFHAFLFYFCPPHVCVCVHAHVSVCTCTIVPMRDQLPCQSSRLRRIRGGVFCCLLLDIVCQASRGSPVSASHLSTEALRFQIHTTTLDGPRALSVQTQVLTLVWQALCSLAHLCCCFSVL